MTVEKNEIIPRILRDMNDGVLVVDMHGKIIFLNDKGCNMLGVDENVSGKNYGRVFLEDRDNGNNDGVHQFVLDAVSQRGRPEAVPEPTGPEDLAELSIDEKVALYRQELEREKKVETESQVLQENA